MQKNCSASRAVTVFLPPRRPARVVEEARLESVYTGNRIKGSNPLVSAFGRRSFSEGDLRFSFQTDCHSRRPSGSKRPIEFIIAINSSTNKFERFPPSDRTSLIHLLFGNNSLYFFSLQRMPVPVRIIFYKP